MLASGKAGWLMFAVCVCMVTQISSSEFGGHHGPHPQKIYIHKLLHKFLKIPGPLELKFRKLY